jgi:hypothetical protein
MTTSPTIAIVGAGFGALAVADTAFTTGCPGWYTTADDKVTFVWAGSHVEYRRRTRVFDPSIYYYAVAARPAATAVAA